MFSLHVYEERRNRLKALMPEKSLAIISAAHEVIRNRDAEYPFRQSSDFWYLTGFTEPDAVLVIGPGQADRLFVRSHTRSFVTEMLSIRLDSRVIFGTSPDLLSQTQYW